MLLQDDPAFSLDEELAGYTNVNFTDNDSSADPFGAEAFESVQDAPAKKQKTEKGDKGLDLVNSSIR